MRKLRVFAASPADVATERAKVETIASKLEPLANSLDIVLDVVDWRAVVPDKGRPQQVILDQLDPTAWDVFIGILWHRFGTPPGGEDPHTQREYLAGTEEEFKVARHLWQQFGRPRIIMYRCTRDIPHDALDPDQFKRVKEFFAQFDALEGEHPGLYQPFDTTEAFETLLLDNLQKLLLEYGEHIKGKPVAAEVVQELAPKPDNLPRRAPFFGRDEEMGRALRALSPDDRTWGVIVDGIGGIGKTALAVEAAYCCKDQGLFDAFIFVSAKQNILAPGGIRESTPAARTLDGFFDETAHMLGEKGILQLAGDDKRRALLDALRSERALLIYDNLETLAIEAQEALADFLRKVPPGCKAIITSRRRGGEGSVWLRLRKLDWEDAREIIQSEMTRDPQLASKLRRVGEARWPELYDETRGSPLALMHTLGLMRVRASLTFDGALEMLRGNRTPDLEKFIFHEARQELTVNDQDALVALSFFAPSATFEAWMDLAKMSHDALKTTIDRLSAFSLVDFLADEERYALHPLTRNFVRDELWARGGSKNDQAVSMRMRGLVAHQRKEYGAAEQLLQDALGIWRDLKDDGAIAGVLNSLGELERERKQYDSAERYFREALELARKVDHREGLAIYSGSLGWLALDRQCWAEACEWFEQELQLAQDIGRQGLIAAAQDGLARVHEAEGHPDVALPLAQAALAIHEQLRHEDLTKTRELVERLRKALGGQ